MRLNHIGISGGKDSTALLLWALHESGYPFESLRFSFSDTGNEHEETYRYVKYLSDYVASHGARPIVWLYPERDFYELVIHKHRFPSARARFCTEELKLLPARRYCDWLIEGGHEILLHTGVRAGESEDRAKMSERSIDSYLGLSVYRPLLKWTLADVWAIHDRYGVKRNPLYAMGMTRVGCMPCVMSRKSEIQRIAEIFPDRIELIRCAEGQTKTVDGRRIATFFARDKVPLRFRSKIITTDPKTKEEVVQLEGLFVDTNSTIHLYQKQPEQMAVATIDDVVRWAKTYDPDAQEVFPNDDEEWETRGTCASESGACE